MKADNNEKVGGGYDGAWLDSLPDLTERHWIECPYCHGVFAIFARGIDPRRTPALIYARMAYRDGALVFPIDAFRPIERVACGDCGHPIADKVNDIFGSTRWFRRGPTVPEKEATP